MSYDVDLFIDTGGAEPHALEVVGNYTSNVGPMFRAAIGPRGLHTLDGLTGRDALPTIRHAVRVMKRDRDKYDAMNPENGWGTREGAVEFLRAIGRACVEHPAATVRVTS